MSSVSRRLFLGGLPMLAVAASSAQFKRAEGAAPSGGEADATFRVDVNVVNIFAYNVENREGRIVNTLSKEDFEIIDNGKPREIQYFSRQSDLPLSIGLLIDTSMSQRGVLDEEREASRRFLKEVLRPEQDSAFVIKFDAEVELLQDLTASKPLLEEALSALRTPEPALQRRLQSPLAASPFQVGVGIPIPGGRSRRGGNGGRRGGGARTGGGGRTIPAGIGTALYDAVYLASDEVLAKQRGRKAVLILSDGVDFGSKVSQAAAIEAAHRADTLVYSVLYVDENGPARGGRMAGRMPDGRKTLESLSRPSRGALFEVSTKKSLSAIYAQIQEDLRNQYSLGFAPETGTGPAFRKLELRVRDKQLKVQAREGYYPRPA
ncbi:MAG: VWA domain-containing protein [Bryobacterales bacterium]|nr:VWA domain-containing protein [Bryobacterales bacterium]